MSKNYEYVATLFDNVDNANNITVAFTMANKALEKGYSAAIILMVDAIHLAIPGAIDDLNIGAPFQAVKNLYESFLQNGGKIFVCQSCMVHNQVGEDAIDNRLAIITADGVIDLLMNAKGSLQLT